jgi:hypothetical protein
MSAASKACEQLALLEGDSAVEDGLSRSRIQVDYKEAHTLKLECSACHPSTRHSVYCRNRAIMRLNGALVEP